VSRASGARSARSSHGEERAATNSARDDRDAERDERHGPKDDGEEQEYHREEQVRVRHLLRGLTISGGCATKRSQREERLSEEAMSKGSLVLILGVVVIATGAVVLHARGPSGDRVQEDKSVGGDRIREMVIVPQEDRFTPFAVTVNVGEAVRWVNQDTDDHTVVSDDAFNTAGHGGTNQLLPGTDSNGGVPGTFELRFLRPGTFVYYCRFHAHLDAENQPTAPGPEGGIQDANGNFGTPMMGVVTVLPGSESED